MSILRERSRLSNKKSLPTTPNNATENNNQLTLNNSRVQTSSDVVPLVSLSRRALTNSAQLANLLPTGTLLAFQLLTPIFTNNGKCDPTTRSLTLGLYFLLAISCFLACFTDSFRASDGQVYYGFATLKGMWLFDYPGSRSCVPDLSKCKLGFIDCVHAVLSVMVFGVVALKDRNVVSCFYPKPQHGTQEVLDIVPIGIGLISSLLFLIFPSRRRGIGYTSH